MARGDAVNQVHEAVQREEPHAGEVPLQRAGEPAAERNGIGKVEAEKRRGGLSRRELIKGALMVEAAALVGCSSHHKEPLTQSIQGENQRQGTMDWMLKNTRIDPKTKYRCPWIEGYCSHTSIRAGEELTIFVSTNPAASLSL